MIAGVVVKPLVRISDERGSVLHMLRCDDPEFERFGEIYFSTVYPGVVKGWHRHREMTLNYAVVQGMIKLTLFDDRESSPSRGEIQEIFLGDANYCLVKIPPRIWNGFKGVGSTLAIVANCASLPHHPDEIERMDPLTDRIPYDWGLRHR
jgi:dTDP-4-dehydrorhamnose 3,5-epimerase